jgi:hypothetical protein
MVPKYASISGDNTEVQKWAVRSGSTSFMLASTVNTTWCHTITGIDAGPSSRDGGACGATRIAMVVAVGAKYTGRKGCDSESGTRSIRSTPSLWPVGTAAAKRQ